MAVSVEISGIRYEALDYSVEMEATPLTLDDTSQSTGSFSVRFYLPEDRDPILPSYGKRVINPIHNPILDSSRVSYDPSDYAVEDITSGDRRGVRVRALGPSSTRGWFTLSGISPFVAPVLPAPFSIYPRAVGATFYVLVRAGGGATGMQYRARTPLGGFPPGSSSGGSVGIPDDLPGAARIDAYLNTDGTASVQPSTAPFPDLRLYVAAGGYMDFFEVSTEYPVANGDQRYYYVSGHERKYGWAGPRGDSPSIEEYFQWTPTTTGSRKRRDLVGGLGSLLFQGAPVKLIDSELGTLEGEVSGVTVSEGGEVSIDCETRLNVFNAYRVAFRPSDASFYGGYEGTLREAVDYYTSKTRGATIWVDPEVAERRVRFLGWSGELWVHLKQLASVSGCELSVVGGLPTFRPIRRGTLTPGRLIERRVSTRSPALSQSVAVVTPGASLLSGGTVPCSYLESNVLSAAPGTSETFSLPVEATLSEVSLGSFVFSDEEGRLVSGSRVKLSVRLDEIDSSLVHVTMAPDSNIRTSNVYLSPRAVNNSARENSLELRGSGLALDPRTISLPTGVDPLYATEVGATLESPFIQNEEDAIRVGVRSLSTYSLPRINLSAVVDRSLPWGVTGAVGEVTYRLSVPELESMTGAVPLLYSSVRSFSSARSHTYSSLRESVRKSPETWGSPQEFGSVAGSRVWDEPTRRWYRIRSARISRSAISFEAEDDLTLGEAVQPWEDAGLTYGEASLTLPGVHVGGSNPQPTYKELYLAGVVNV